MECELSKKMKKKRKNTGNNTNNYKIRVSELDFFYIA